MDFRTALYDDRTDAGRVLADRLRERAFEAPTVLAIPNGGVAVGMPIAQNLNAELRLLLVRKIQIPGHSEAGFGAVAADGTTVLDRALMENLRLDEKQIEAQKQRSLGSISRRSQHFGSWARLPQLQDATTVLVDDGLATGSTMEAAVRIVRTHKPRRVVVAVPTSSRRAFRRLEPLVDDIICPNVAGTAVFAVADAYRRWHDLSDDEVLQMLGTTSPPPPSP